MGSQPLFKFLELWKSPTPAEGALETMLRPGVAYNPLKSIHVRFLERNAFRGVYLALACRWTWRFSIEAVPFSGRFLLQTTLIQGTRLHMHMLNSFGRVQCKRANQNPTLKSYLRLGHEKRRPGTSDLTSRSVRHSRSRANENAWP